MLYFKGLHQTKEFNSKKKGGKMHKNACRLLLLYFIFLFSFPSFARLRCRQTKGTTWSGWVELTNFTQRIKVHSYFLDIEEDIELAPIGRKPPNNLNTLEIVGEFWLPAQSVITGILIWDGDNLLQGKLKGKEHARVEYEEVVDRETTSPPRPRDPILIEKRGSRRRWAPGSRTDRNMDMYNCSIYPVKWGNSRKIRIRYLCPQKYINNKLIMQIPPSFSDEASKYPTKITQKISSYGDIDRITLFSYFDTIDYSLPTILVENHDIRRLYTTYIQIPETENSMMVKTGFSEGDWKGNYAMYWGTPPDSLLIKAGLRREIVFLWKWNFWHTFVYNDNSTKTISPYGTEAINQARQIYNTNIKITEAGDRVGLLLEKGAPGLNKVFPLCRQSSKTFDSLQSFLSSIDSSHLVTTISGTAPPIKIRIAEDDRENFFSQNTKAFDISLKLICSLFSEHEKVLKHIVFISAGPVPEMPNLEDFYNGSDKILDGNISISAYGSSPRYPTGYWPGVPMYRIVENHALLSDGEFANGFWVPEKKKARFSMTVKNSNKSYTKNLVNIVQQNIYDIDLHGYVEKNDTLVVDTTYFAGHSTSEWDDAIRWKAFDNQSNLLASYDVVPPTHVNEKDTFCVKLWAGANNPVSDTSFLSNRGARYGIVDEKYSLLALEEDVVTQEEKGILENTGLPFLKDDEIFLSDPVEGNVNTSIKEKLQQVSISKLIFIQLRNSSFKLLLPKNEKIETIRIYDLRGRLVFQSTKNRSNTRHSFTFHNHGRLSKGIYTVVIQTNVKRYIKGFQILQ